MEERREPAGTEWLLLVLVIVAGFGISVAALMGVMTW
jgi:hypothetical protein